MPFIRFTQKQFQQSDTHWGSWLERRHLSLRWCVQCWVRIKNGVDFTCFPRTGLL